MGKREDHERKRSKTAPIRGAKKAKEERTLIDREKLTELMFELEKFRQKNKLLPVEYEFLLTKSLEIMKECNKETFAVAKEIERRKMIGEAIKRNQVIAQKQTNGNGGTVKYVT